MGQNKTVVNLLLAYAMRAIKYGCSVIDLEKSMYINSNGCISRFRRKQKLITNICFIIGHFKIIKTTIQLVNMKRQMSYCK